MTPNQAEFKQGIKELIAAKINDGSIEEIVNKKIEEMTNDIVKSVMGNRVTYYLEKQGLNPDNIHFGHFIEMAEKLKLPIFEVEIYNNPFIEPNTTITHKCYESIKDFDTSGYDFKSNYCWKRIPDIFKGSFTIYADSGSSTRNYAFVVTDFAVLIHLRYNVWD